MQILTNNYSIAEVIEMLDSKALVVNREYQRGSGLWPSGARSYFIDTILEGYPFPKIYFFEYSDLEGGRIKRELVDGQQRVRSIHDFVNNKYQISGDSKYRNEYFRTLEPEVQSRFLQYTVSVDVIRGAQKYDILEMFRRMNAYTLPLNNAEKRHSSFDGEFKWFVNGVTDNWRPFFSDFGVFTDRQIVRMADAELIAELVLCFEDGIVSTKPSDLNRIYKENEENFTRRDLYEGYINEAFEYVASNFSVLRKTFMMKPYAVWSLAIALVHSRHNLESVSESVRIDGSTCDDTIQAEALLRLAGAHEAKEMDGPHGRYVWGCLGGTNRTPRRIARLVDILAALGEAPKIVDSDAAKQIPESLRG